MVVRAYAVCIGVKLECRWTESEMVGDGQGHVDKVDKAYHDSAYYLEWSQVLLHQFPQRSGCAEELHFYIYTVANPEGW